MDLSLLLIPAIYQIFSLIHRWLRYLYDTEILKKFMIHIVTINRISSVFTARKDSFTN